MEESLWELAPLFQLAGSPSLKTVSLTFSIQVAGLKCRCERIFLPRRSQTAGRRVHTNLPAFLFLPRQHEREGGVQNQTRRHRRWSRCLANLEHPLPLLGQPVFWSASVASRAPGGCPPPALPGAAGAEQPSGPGLSQGQLPGNSAPCLPTVGFRALNYPRPSTLHPHLGALQDTVGTPVS